MIFFNGWVYRFAVLILLTALTGVGCMPKSMQVRTGNDPRYQDDDVRFRTVYYFRVFEYCENKEGTETGGNGPYEDIEKDTLYRFLMTGKGSSIWNDIHFESGILQQSQIDPFGALLSYDEDSRQFYYKSTEEIAMQNRKKNLKLVDDEFEKLIKFRKDYEALLKSANTNPPAGTSNPASGNANSVTKNKSKESPSDAFEKQFNEYLLARAKNINSNFSKITSAPATTSKSSTTTCSDSSPANQEFWILGPEGWRKFNPDERLLLAMSSSGKPLISAMKEISGRILNEKSATTSDETFSLKERLNVSKALDKFQEWNPDEDPEKSKVAVKKTIDEAIQIIEGKDVAEKEVTDDQQ